MVRIPDNATRNCLSESVTQAHLAEHTYVDSEDEVLTAPAGVTRSALAKRFARASDADLHTAAAHYVYRKPG